MGDSRDRALKCDHSLDAVEQYFTVLLFVNPLTPRVKPWVIQSFLTFEPMYRTLKCDHSLDAVEQYFTVVLLVFQLNPVRNFGRDSCFSCARNPKLQYDFKETFNKTTQRFFRGCKSSGTLVR